MACMEPNRQQHTPTPDEIVADLAIGVEVTDVDLSRAFHTASGAAHRRLEREVLRRCEKGIKHLASKDADVAEEVRAALQLEVLARHPRSVASSGGIESYGGWVRKIVGKNAPAHAAHARLDYAVGLNRALRIEKLSREYLDIRSTEELHARMAADRVEEPPSVEDADYAMALQARRRAASLTPPEGADEGWTDALVGSSPSVTSAGVRAPGAEPDEEEGAARALLLEMGFNGDEATVLVCEHGLDGATPVSGQREIAEATGVDYGRVRSVRVTLQRKIARLDVGAVRGMLALTEPRAPRIAETRRDVAAGVLAAAVAAVEVGGNLRSN